jgi:hypothetical protein
MRQNVFAEDPLPHVGGEEIPADVPDGPGIVGAGSADSQRQCGQYLGERRVLFVEAQVEPLQVAQAGADVGDLIDSNGLAEGGAPGQHEHERQKQQGRDRNARTNGHESPLGIP